MMALFNLTQIKQICLRDFNGGEVEKVNQETFDYALHQLVLNTKGLMCTILMARHVGCLSKIWLINRRRAEILWKRC